MANTERRPRAIVKLNGERVRAFDNVAVTLIAKGEADTFSVVVANDQGKYTGEFDERTDAEKSGKARPEVEIWMGKVDDEDYGEADLVKMMHGVVDEVGFGYSRDDGEAITLTGRDMTALLLDARISKKFPKRPAASHVREMVEAHGLALELKASGGATTAFVEDDATEWDVVEAMARKMKAVVFAAPGTKTIYVGPRQKKELLPPLVFRVNTQRLTIKKNLTQKFEVEVSSWDADKKTGIVGKYPAKPEKGAQKRFYRLPEIRTIAEAKERAKSIYEELSRDAVEVEATFAFNPLYMPEHQVVVGYEGDPDPLGPLARAYYVNEVTHRIGKRGGGTTDVKALLPVEEFRAKG
jgi:phage protein D